MEKDKTAQDILKEFARGSDREFEYNEVPHPSSDMISKITYHRRNLYIPENSNSTCYFVCFADSKEMGPKALFSGVFMPFDVLKTTTLDVRKKDILDKLNPFGKKNICKTGTPTFDSQYQISSNDPTAVKRIFQNRGIQNLVADAFKLDGVIQVGINNADVEFVPGLKGKSQLGIYTRQEWITDGRMIEKLFGLMEMGAGY